MATTKASVDRLFQRLGERHERLLEEIAAGAVRALAEENERLADEVSRLQGKLRQLSRDAHEPKKPRGAPPIPAVPVRLPLKCLKADVDELDDDGPVQSPSASGLALPACVARVSDGSTPTAGYRLGRPMLALAPAPTAPPPDLPPAKEEPSERLSLSTAPEPPASQPTVPGFVEDDDDDEEEDEDEDEDEANDILASLPVRHFATAPDLRRKATDSVLSRLNVKFKNRQRRRIREILKLDPKMRQVSASRLHKRVKLRDPSSPLTESDVHCIVQELNRILDKMGCGGRLQSFTPTQSSTASPTISFDGLVDCLLLPNLLDLASQQMYNLVRMFHDTMMTQTVSEVVDEATRGALEKEVLHKHIGGWEGALNGIVATSVIVSIVSMGTSIDFYEGHYAWIILEGACAFVFVAEMVIKCYMWGLLEYISGENWKWNLLDLSVTILSLAQLALSLYDFFNQSDERRSGGSTTVGTARIALMLRLLRFTRVLRLVKLVHSPWLRELANMMVGCVIGVAPLCWVLVLLLFILFMAGLGFRIVLGPGRYQDEIGRCGMGDDFILTDSNADCKVHWMYGEEFFPSVKTSMFTAFRFMLGDYNTKDGRSLAVVFSRAYGDRFHFCFCAGMIMVMFGLFNIITAIFVDTVITGLKHNDVKRKYSRLYERHYVKKKLMDLLDKVAICLQEKRQRANPDRRASNAKPALRASGGWFVRSSHRHESEQHAVEDLTLTEDDFMEVMDDPMVRSVLIDLDCAIPDPSAVFDTFDPDDSGEVSAAELVQAVLKLRGEPAKNDMVAAWVALRQLHEKLDHVQMMLIEAGATDMDAKDTTAAKAQVQVHLTRGQLTRGRTAML